MGLDNVAADGQAQAGPAKSRGVRASFRGEEGLEDSAKILWRDPNAVVDHAELDKTSCRIGCQSERRHAAPGHRLAGVDQEVDQHLLDLGGIHPGMRAAQKLDLEPDLVPRQVLPVRRTTSSASRFRSTAVR